MYLRGTEDRLPLNFLRLLAQVKPRVVVPPPVFPFPLLLLSLAFFWTTKSLADGGRSKRQIWRPSRYSRNVTGVVGDQEVGAEYVEKNMLCTYKKS